MKVLVTGGAGFIGSNLCRRLVEDARVAEIAVIDDLSTGFAGNLAGVDVQLIEGSILDAETLERAASGCDAIVHLAALGSVPRSVAEPLASHAANATGTLQVLEAARKEDNAHVVLASSSSVYGANPILPKSEELLCMPMSPYAVSKLATEQYAMAYAQCYALPVLPFRFFNVYGPRQMPGHAYAAVIPVLLEAALAGNALPINGDGEQSRDFTFIDTVTEAIVQAITGRVTSSPVNLAFGTRTTLNTVVGLIEQAVGHELAIERRPPRGGDVRHSQAESVVLTRLFPELRTAALAEGIKATLEWMRLHVAPH